MNPRKTLRFGRAVGVALVLGVAAGSTLAQENTQLAQSEQRLVCTAGTSFGYVVTFSTKLKRRLCVTFKWVKGTPGGAAPPPGYCRWSGWAPTPADCKINVFCQNLPNEFRIERRGNRMSYKTTDALYLDRLDDPDFRYFLNVTRQKRSYKVNSVGPLSR